MKSLDEVIEIFEKVVKHDYVWFDEKTALMTIETLTDVLHYLKEYQGLSKMWNDKLDKEQENPALTWDELRTMEGKPVWVEESADNGLWWTYWVIWEDEKNATLPEKTYGTAWQAYRKERNE